MAVSAHLIVLDLHLLSLRPVFSHGPIQNTTMFDWQSIVKRMDHKYTGLNEFGSLNIVVGVILIMVHLPFDKRDDPTDWCEQTSWHWTRD